MRKHGLSFLAPALAGVLGVVPACSIFDPNNGDDDDDDAASGTACAADDESGNGTAAEGSGTAADGTASESTAADTAGVGVCGWGPTGDPAVPEGYVCGGEGEDPSGMIARLCPEAVDLQVGGSCDGIAGVGCCDAQGNAWFCGDVGSGPALARIEC
jgi:hypothetical protein